MQVLSDWMVYLVHHCCSVHETVPDTQLGHLTNELVIEQMGFICKK